MKAPLTSRQRDGLHEFVSGHLEADSLGHYVRDADASAVKELVGTLPACIRLLDEIG